jgi:hypothetical protein
MLIPENPNTWLAYRIIVSSGQQKNITEYTKNKREQKSLYCSSFTKVVPASEYVSIPKPTELHT